MRGVSHEAFPGEAGGRLPGFIDGYRGESAGMVDTTMPAWDI
jgi:hypothetical protein